jgi:hypothetical protein
MAALPADYLRRLVYAKYLLRRATELLRHRTLLATAEALLALHDGAEILMRVVGDQLRVKQFYNFMEFWSRIKDVTGNEPAHRATMDRLNDARNSFKHKGIPPDRTVVSGFQALVEEFCGDLCSQYLGLDYEKLTMGSLISNNKARELVEESEKLFESGDKRNAMNQLAFAFDELYFSARQDAHEVVLKPPATPSFPSTQDFTARKLIDIAKDFAKDHERMADTVNMLLLGIDPLALLFFKRSTPGVVRFAGGRVEIDWNPRGVPAPDDEPTYLRCRDFVIEFSLRTDELFRA